MINLLSYNNAEILPTFSTEEVMVTYNRHMIVSTLAQRLDELDAALVQSAVYRLATLHRSQHDVVDQ
jgi:hypothetical protein